MFILAELEGPAPVEHKQGIDEAFIVRVPHPGLRRRAAACWIKAVIRTVVGEIGGADADEGASESGGGFIKSCA